MGRFQWPREEDYLELWHEHMALQEQYRSLLALGAAWAARKTIRAEADVRLEEAGLLLKELGHRD